MLNLIDQYCVFYEGGERIDGFKAYLLNVFAAAMVCAIITKLSANKGSGAIMLKLIAGLFLVFSVINPIAAVDLDLSDLTISYTSAGMTAVEQGKELTQNAMAKIIKSKTEAYILDKAAQLNVQLKVEVTLSKEDIPVPVAVQLTGKVSPYAKGRLQTIITEELGIKGENQLWT